MVLAAVLFLPRRAPNPRETAERRQQRARFGRVRGHVVHCVLQSAHGSGRQLRVVALELSQDHRGANRARVEQIGIHRSEKLAIAAVNQSRGGDGFVGKKRVDRAGREAGDLGLRRQLHHGNRGRFDSVLLEKRTQHVTGRGAWKHSNLLPPQALDGMNWRRLLHDDLVERIGVIHAAVREDAHPAGAMDFQLNDRDQRRARQNVGLAGDHGVHKVIAAAERDRL